MPVFPSIPASAVSMLVIIDFRFLVSEEEAKETAASTLGSMAPLVKCFSSIYWVASSTVMESRGISSAVPKFRATFSTPVRRSRISASNCSARQALVRSFSITALAPFSRVPCWSTGIPPPPAAITICSASISALMASNS